MVHVPYRGEALALNDLLGGQVQVVFGTLPPSAELIKAGRLRALAVTTATRSEVLPDIPTIAEGGVPGYEAVNWWGMVAPAGTSQAIIDKLNRELEVVQKSPEVQKQFANEGAEPVAMKPADFGGFMVSEMNKWEKVVKQGNIKAE